MLSELVDDHDVDYEYHEWQNDSANNKCDESEQLKELVVRHVFRVY